MNEKELTQHIAEQVAVKAKTARVIEEDDPELARDLRQQYAGQIDLANSLGLDVDFITQYAAQMKELDL